MTTQTNIRREVRPRAKNLAHRETPVREVPAGAAPLFKGFVFFFGCQPAADVPLGLVDGQNIFYVPI